MSEDMKVTLARLEALATPVGEPKPLFGYEVVATLLKHIRELQASIGHYQAELWQAETAYAAWNSSQDRIAKLEELLTVERQRREEAEAALRSTYMNAPVACRAKARAYFSRHPSSSGNEPDNREKVAG